MSGAGSVFFIGGVAWTLVGIWLCMYVEHVTHGRAVRWVADSAVGTTLAVVLWPLVVVSAVLDWLLGLLLRRRTGRYWQ